MNRDDIIRMAREAGVGRWDAQEVAIERFAAFVAAAEREACAQMVDHILKEGGGSYGDAIRTRSQA